MLGSYFLQVREIPLAFAGVRDAIPAGGLFTSLTYATTRLGVSWQCPGAKDLQSLDIKRNDVLRSA